MEEKCSRGQGKAIVKALRQECTGHVWGQLRGSSGCGGVSKVRVVEMKSEGWVGTGSKIV